MLVWLMVYWSSLQPDVLNLNMNQTAKNIMAVIWLGNMFPSFQVAPFTNMV